MLGFSHIAWALNQVTRSGGKEKYLWVLSQQQVFDDLNHHLCSTWVLSLPDLQQPFDIKTYGSNFVVGTFLTHHNHPVAYNSDKLSYVICKYSTYEKYMYSTVQAYLQRRHFILEKEIFIHTDHKPL